MNPNAYGILGIAPTNDGREIRAAFLRVARIFHPDRFAGMPDEVRDEAERRMKEATAAYDSLRALSAEAPPAEPQIDEAELAKRTRAFRAAIELRLAEEERHRARWRRWDQIERETRDRAAREARMAAEVEREVTGETFYRPTVPDPAPARPVASSTPVAAPKRESSLVERLDAARRGEKAALALRREVPA